jgi:peroxiredoxin
MQNQMDGRVVPLAPGTVAPDFTLPQTPRARLALHGLRGRPVVLVFYPLDWEPVSAEQLALYQDYAGDFDRLGARPLAISCDHVHSHQAFAREAQLSFPLLADFQPRGAVARRYGVYREGEGVSARPLRRGSPGRHPLQPGVSRCAKPRRRRAPHGPEDAARWTGA